MRVTRLVIDGFRGWEHLDLRPRDHVLVAGVPRSGRSDVIAALVRVLDPDSARGASLTDLRQWTRDSGEPGAPLDVLREEFAEIEVTLSDLDPEMEQLLDGYLEPLDSAGAPSVAIDADPSLPQCARIAYRLSYDQDLDSLEAITYFPVVSDPAIGRYVRVPVAVRKAIPVLTLSSSQPMQIRPGGRLRQIIDRRAPDEARRVFERLYDAVKEAIADLAKSPIVTEAVGAVLTSGGAGHHLGGESVSPEDFGFLAEDGSIAALLRTLQAALRLDTGGLLSIANQGSTATGILSLAEAMTLANIPGAIVLADDFGDRLDTAAAEHLAAVLRANSGQTWLSTRRPEVARAFEPSELVRLVRHGGTREHYQLEPTTDRKELTAMRQLHTQILAALTAPVIVITEGPHDMAVYSKVDRRYPPSDLPLSAYGVRLVSAGTGNDGGIDQIPRVAKLARSLGFKVVALVDRDKDTGQSKQQIEKIQETCDLVVRLPSGAVERAVLAGIELKHVAAASSALTVYGVPDPCAGLSGDDAVTNLIRVVHKHGLHEQLLEALYAETGEHPPMIKVVLDALSKFARFGAHEETSIIEIQDVPRPLSEVSG